jgi:hypothetical protein
VPERAEQNRPRLCRPDLNNDLITASERIVHRVDKRHLVDTRMDEVIVLVVDMPVEALPVDMTVPLGLMALNHRTGTIRRFVVTQLRHRE